MPDDSLLTLLGFAWTEHRRADRFRRQYHQPRLWIGQKAAHEYHRRYRKRMGR